MKHNWILNASPLILLGKAGLLRTISPLAECWHIPENVVRELSRRSSIDAILSELSENAQVYRQKENRGTAPDYFHTTAFFLSTPQNAVVRQAHHQGPQ